jgi:hypothetical protein
MLTLFGLLPGLVAMKHSAAGVRKALTIRIVCTQWTAFQRPGLPFSDVLRTVIVWHYVAGHTVDLSILPDYVV